MNFCSRKLPPPHSEKFDFHVETLKNIYNFVGLQKQYNNNVTTKVSEREK